MKFHHFLKLLSKQTVKTPKFTYLDNAIGRVCGIFSNTLIFENPVPNQNAIIFTVSVEVDVEISIDEFGMVTADKVVIDHEYLKVYTSAQITDDNGDPTNDCIFSFYEDFNEYVLNHCIED